MANFSSRNGTAISLIAVHTNEGPNAPGDEGRDRSAENLAKWMDGQQVSYHKVIDDDSVVNYVADQHKAWALRNGNPRSLNVCLTGYARQTRAEWLQHDRQLRLAADVVRAWCDRYGIPKVKLSSAAVGADRSGVCGHLNWTEGKRDGSHSDPGPEFPWDVFMRYVSGQQAGPAPSTPPTSNGSYAGPYRHGSRDLIVPGGGVWRVQNRLKSAYRAYAGHLDLDGVFGDQTGDAVGEFQRRSGLDDDEVVGPVTWAALRL